MSDGLQNVPDFSLCPGGPHGLLMNGQCALNSPSILMKLGSTVRGEFELSIALLFGFILAFSAKRTISNFRSNSRRKTCNF
jgi:hypothetical protein